MKPSLHERWNAAGRPIDTTWKPGRTEPAPEKETEQELEPATIARRHDDCSIIQLSLF